MAMIVIADATSARLAVAKSDLAVSVEHCVVDVGLTGVLVLE